MSEKVTGLVVEMNRNSCIIMTPDGDFVEAAKPHGRKLIHGEEATLHRYQPFPNQRRLALVACLLIALMGWTAYSSFVPVAVAYVSLDINPSLELAIDRNGEVIRAVGFNPEAETLLEQVPVEGRPVTEVIENLIDTAVALNYIDQEKDNEILVTVDLEPKAPPEVIDEKVIEETITRSIAKNNVEAEISVTPVEPALRKQANEKKVSTGKYLLYQEQLKRQGNPVVPPEVKEELQQKHLNDLGYHSWSPEKIQHLNKNQNNTSHKVNNQQQQGYSDKKPSYSWPNTGNNSGKKTDDNDNPGPWWNKGSDSDNEQPDDSDDKSDNNDNRSSKGNHGRNQQSWNSDNEDKNDKDNSSDAAADDQKSWFEKSRNNWNQRLQNLKKNQQEKWQSWYKNQGRY